MFIKVIDNKRGFDNNITAAGVQLLLKLQSPRSFHRFFILLLDEPLLCKAWKMTQKVDKHFVWCYDWPAMQNRKKGLERRLRSAIKTFF